MPKNPAVPPPAHSPFRDKWKLDPGVVFLNHGSFGACPAAILDFQSELRRQMEAEPVQFLWRRYEERLEPSRAELARFIGARQQDIVFVGNATAGINAVLRSFPLERGDELLTTSLDYNACRNALVEIARQRGAVVCVASLPFPLQHPGEIVQAVLRTLTPRTKLAMIDHVTSDSGMILPVADIIRALAERGVETLVDGAHAPGMVDLDFTREPRPAFYTGNLHKWVCAPKGAAFLWVREDFQAEMQPAVISHGNNRPRAGYTPFQDRFDWQGTIDPTAWFSVGEAIRWMGALLPGGWRELREHNRALAVEARRHLCSRFQVGAACPESMLGCLAAVQLPSTIQGRPRGGKIDSEQLDLYDRWRIEVPFSRIGTPPVRHLRVSAQIYNTKQDYEYLCNAVASLV